MTTAKTDRATPELVSDDGSKNEALLPTLARRVSRGLLGAVLAGVVASILDARWSAAAGELPVSAFVLAVLALLAPVALVVGALVSMASLFLHPARAPSPAMLGKVLSRGDEAERARRAWLILWLGPFAFLWLWAVSKVSLVVLASELDASQSGAVMAAAVVVLGALFGLGALGLGRASAARVPNVSATGLFAASLVCFFLLLTLSIAVGDTSGVGSAWAVFGVFKRPELDLRASGLLLLMALGAYLAPAWLSRLRAVFALGLAAVPLLLLPLASRALAGSDAALSIERGSALSKRTLALFQRASDSDKDGFSDAFGGGDCNDQDPKVNPGADDIPANGIDEDCSGSDAKKIDFGDQKKEPPKDQATWMREKLDKKFNVVLLTVDTMRWDLGYMGNARPISPHFDALAKRSTVFEHGYSLASYTSKSLPPMLIGKYPSETHRNWAHFDRFSSEDSFIQERLQKAGIRTVSVQGYWYFFHKGYGFERGFDVLDSSAAPKVIQMEGDKSSNGDKLSDAAIAQLAQPEMNNQQFFMWLHYVDPHSEYAPHEGFDFGSDSRARYDGEVAFVDHHAGRVLDAIEKSPFADRTAIIVSSDHGEAFKEHGMIRHGFEVWEELVRVPLIVHVPGAKPGRIKVRRSAIDVAPTILELYKLELPNDDGSNFVSGKSLLPDVLMPPGHEPEERVVLVDMPAGPNNGERQAYYENEYKLIASDGRPLGLYDLAKDPGEKNDLKKDEELLDRVSERFKAFRRQLRVVHVRRQ